MTKNEKNKIAFAKMVQTEMKILWKFPVLRFSKDSCGVVFA
jgi:hypothetical protein